MILITRKFYFVFLFLVGKTEILLQLLLNFFRVSNSEILFSLRISTD